MISSAYSSFAYYVYLVALIVLNAQSANGEDQNGTLPSTIYNNFVTDFLPILFLFGENPTKQFMSQALCWADNLIIAIAPIGSLMIVINAIRVANITFWLKGLKGVIGRARESIADVEKELLISTSDEVCEIWEGRTRVGDGKVVRVQGKRDIQAIFYDDANHEVYTLTDVTRKHYLVPEHNDEGFDSLPPNLGLNVGGELMSMFNSWLFAFLALFLQVGFLGLDGVLTYRFGWSTNGGNGAGFPVALVGTVFLCTGLALCSNIVESSTKKVKFIPKGEGKNLKLVWLQRGLRQNSINDKNGLAIERSETIKDPSLKPIWAAKKVDNDNDDPNQTQWTQMKCGVGVILSVIGFLIQAEGLRWMTWMASFLQLILTIFMFVLRGLLRRGLSINPKVTEIHDGHELDWLTMKMANVVSWNVSKIQFDSVESEGEIPSLDQFSELSMEISELSMEIAPSIRTTIHFDGLRRRESLKVEETSNGIVDLRIKLGHLTQWNTAVKEIANKLSECIQKTFNYLINIELENPQPVLFDKEFQKDPVANFKWSVPVEVIIGGSHKLHELVHLQMPRATFLEQISGTERLGPWRVDIDKIEALLSLWTYQFKKEFKRVQGALADLIFVIGPSKDYNDVYGKWISRYSPINPVYINPNLTQLAMREEYRDPKELHEFIYVGYNLPSRDPIRARAHKHQIAKGTVDTRPPWEYIGYRYKVLYSGQTEEGVANLILPTRVYAQHLYASFIASIAPHIESINARAIERRYDADYEGQEAGVPYKARLFNSVFLKLSSFFVQAGLGTEEEAYVCIIPPFKGKIPELEDDELGTDCNGIYEIF